MPNTNSVCIIVPDGKPAKSAVKQPTSQEASLQRLSVGVLILMPLFLIAIGIVDYVLGHPAFPQEAPAFTLKSVAVPARSTKPPRPAPSIRLPGCWRNVDNDSGAVTIYDPVDQSARIGTYRFKNSPSENPGPSFRFKVISEDVAGTSLVIRDFYSSHPAIVALSARIGCDFSKSDVLCYVSEDGQQMTQEYTTADGQQVLNVYQRVQ